MSYHSKILAPGEAILAIGRLHWIIYLRALLMAGLAIALAVFALATATDVAMKAAVLVFALSLLMFLGAWIRQISTEIVVTDRRVIYKRGLISRRTVEMNMNKVETVDVSQSIIGRMLNYGDIIIRGTGSTYEPLRRIKDPLYLRTFIAS